MWWNFGFIPVIPRKAPAAFPTYVLGIPAELHGCRMVFHALNCGVFSESVLLTHTQV